MANVFKENMDKRLGLPDYFFYCEGCECDHGIWTDKNRHGSNAWEFNGNLEKPTISPSIKVTMPVKGVNQICHSYIKEGRIQYLTDCTHHLAGKTIDLPEYQ